MFQINDTVRCQRNDRWDAGFVGEIVEIEIGLSTSDKVFGHVKVLYKGMGPQIYDLELFLNIFENEAGK